AVGVQCLVWTDQAVPPAGRWVAGFSRADDVAVAGQRVLDEDRVGAVAVGFAPGFVGELVGGQGSAVLKRQWVGTEQPLPAAVGVALAPAVAGARALGWLLGHDATFAARNPASKSAFRSSIPSMPTERRTRPGVTPVTACSSGVSWL